MRLRRFAALAVAAVVLCSTVFISAASGSPRSAYLIPHLDIRVHVMFGTLDPGTTQNCFSSYCSNFYDHLLRQDKNGHIAPALALSYKNPVPDTYDFTLRKGVKFWNGDELTANDVAASINYERFPQFNSAIALRNVKNARALSRYVVRISLKHPDASFAVTVAGPTGAAIFQKKFQVAAGSKFGQPGTLTMATGPFIPVSFNGKDTIEAVANPHWWGGKVEVGRLTLHLITDDTAAALAIRSGQIDGGAGYGSPQAMQSALGSAGTAYRVTWGTSEKFWGLNTKLPPFDDVHVRKAVAYAVSRKEHLAVQGGGQALYTIITPEQLAQIATPAQIDALMKKVGFQYRYPFNLAKARAEMAMSKYPNGYKGVTIPTLAFQTAEAQVVAGQLAKIGIQVQVHEEDIGTYLNTFYGPEKKYTLSPGYYACTPDPNGCLQFMLGKDQLSQLNVGQWAPPDIDVLLQQGLRTLNKAKRLAAYTKILERVAQEVPYVPAVLPVYTVMLSKKYTYPGINSLHQEIIFSTPWVLNLRPA